MYRLFPVYDTCMSVIFTSIYSMEVKIWISRFSISLNNFEWYTSEMLSQKLQGYVAK